MRDFGLLVLRLVAGGLMAGHGSQKLFGWFGGYGMQGTAGWLESLGLRPGQRWAALAGAGEFGGGVLTALGFLHPLGPVTTLGPMAMAWQKAHAGKPIWVTEGGAELPLTNMAIAIAVATAGPGRYSMDRLFGIRMPAALVALATAATAAGVLVGMNAHPEPAHEPGTMGQETSAAELQGGVGASASPAS